MYCGDSIMDTYRLAGNSSRSPDVFGAYNSDAWLTKSGGAVWFAVSSSFNDSYEPLFRGQRLKLWEAIPATGKHNVFLSFGLNDIDYGIDTFIQNYRTLINRIQNTGIKARFYVLSITPMRADMQRSELNNANIMRANAKLRAMCQENGWTYVDVASNLRGADNALLTQYSDGTNVHLVNAAYTFWDEALKALAAREITK